MLKKITCDNRKNNRRGILLFGIIVIVAILGIIYFRGFTLQSTETRRVREQELDSKLSQMRRALDSAKKINDFKTKSDFDKLDESTPSGEIQEKLIKNLRGSDSKSVYLRQEFTAPMLDVDAAEKLNIGWRVAVNRVNSSSFEGDNFLKVYRITEETNVSEVNQWWFGTTTDVGLISVTSVYEPPPETDYPGQTDNYGNKGKYGRNVVRMTVR
ncbi:MAG: hypothetical protein QMC67_07765 [Candidatus Wallbacteria bacterium]